MISYRFPPEGSAGVYRSLRFVRQLSKMGWKTTVVTVNPYRHERYDPELLNQVPKETEIISVRASDPWQALQAWRGKSLQTKLSGASIEAVDRVHAVHHASFRSRVREVIRTAEAYYYFPDLAKSWIRPAVQAGRLACARRNPIVIWATISPISAGVVAQKIWQYTDVPYVLDFRDPWELYFYKRETQRPKRVIRWAQRTMYNLFERAQAVIFLFPRVAECYWHAYKGSLDPAKIHIIPNGYEGSIKNFYVSTGNRCTILYTGTVATYRYDTFLQALQYLKMTHPALAKQLRVLFVGDGMGPIARDANALGISEMVETRPPVSYEEVNRLSENAHALLILGRHHERKGHELVAGAKLFGYFKNRKPIIGVLPRDETEEILARVGVETIADANSVSEIVSVLQKVHTAWSEGQLSSLLPNAQACAGYASEPQTLALIRALEGHTPEEPFVPGKVTVPLSLRETIEDESLWDRKK